MQLTTKKLKQLIRQELLRETNRADLEFLRDMKYSDVSLEDYMKIINMHESAEQNNDTIILQYIDDMRNIPRDATSGLLFTLDDIRLINNWLELLDIFEESGDAEPWKVEGWPTKSDFTRFLQSTIHHAEERKGQLGDRAEMNKRWAAAKAHGKKQANRLLPLVHFVHDQTESKRWRRGRAPYDLSWLRFE